MMNSNILDTKIKNTYLRYMHVGQLFHEHCMLLLNVVKAMMVEYRAADSFITDVGDLNLVFSLFDSVTLFNRTAEDTILMVQYFGKWYQNEKVNWNENVFYNYAKFKIKMLQAEPSAVLHGCEIKQENIPADFDELLDIELRATTKIIAPGRN